MNAISTWGRIAATHYIALREELLLFSLFRRGTTKVAGQAREELLQRQHETGKHGAPVERVRFAERRHLVGSRVDRGATMGGIDLPHEFDSGQEVLLAFAFHLARRVALA